MANPTLVQFADGNGSSVAYPGSVTQGNLLVAFLSGTSSFVFDTLGNIWVRVQLGLSVPTGVGLQVYVCYSRFSGANTVQSSTSGFMAIAEFTPANFQFFTPVANGGLSGTVAGAANQLLVGLGLAVSGATLTGVGAGFTQASGSQTSNISLEYKALSGSGSVGSNFTTSGSTSEIGSCAFTLSTPPTPAAGTPTVVQVSNGIIGTSTFLNPVTQGNSLVVVAYTSSFSAAGLDISDSLGNTWTPLMSNVIVYGAGPTQRVMAMWFCSASNAGADTITISGNGVPFMFMAEITSCLVGHNSGVASGNITSSDIKSSSISASSAQLLLGFLLSYTNSGSDIALPGAICGGFAGFASVSQFFFPNQLVHQNVVSSGSYNTDFTTYTENAFDGVYQTGLISLTGNTDLFVISGNAGVAGATISYSGQASGSFIADDFGNYVISGLAAGDYVLTPSLTGETFSPPSANVTITTSNVFGVNFVATQLQTATPTISPAAGTYSGLVTVTISCATPAANIFYTTDGNFEESQFYEGPFVIGPPLTVEAVAEAPGYSESDIVSASYTELPGKPLPSPLPFSKRTTASLALFRCVQIASANGAQWYVTTTPMQRGQLSILYFQMQTTYRSLIHQDRQNQAVKLDVEISVALAQAMALNSIIQAIVPGTASGQAEILQTMQQVCAQAVQQIQNAANAPDDGE